ncbi:MAG: phosphate ABC transporter permease subunit PstC [Bacilli bacterium]|nr:phosphate ABC transporter permease subunit PstC [Bacilli bacterium]
MIDFKKKVLIDQITKNVFLGITLLGTSFIIIILAFILRKGLMPFLNYYDIAEASYKVDFWKFLTGGTWFVSPNIYGVGFIIINTFYIVLIATFLATFISILTALVISRIAPKPIKKILGYIVELLASIPSIIYGLFGMGVITKIVKDISTFFGYQSAGGISTLSTILVLTIMIIPTITLISITSMNAVKNDLINGSLALGASKTQTNFRIVITSAKSGIFTGVILAVGRALGEATAISMVAGNSGSGPNFNLFDTTRTLTSTMLLGLKETTGLDYDIRFSVGIILIGLILISNISLTYFKKRVLK